MEGIFSDNDEFDAFHDQLYEAKKDEDEKLVPMFGMYALMKTTDKPKPRQDLFLRGLEAPSNDLDPYKDVIFEHKKPIVQKRNMCENFSFFGMKQDKFKMESSEFSIQDQIAERNKLLEKVRKMEENADKSEEYCSEKEQENEKSESRKLKTPTHVGTPRPLARKRQRRIVLSSDESSDSEVDYSDNNIFSSNRSPQKKRISPTFD